MNYLKSYLLKTPLAKPLKETEALLQLRHIASQKTTSEADTVYCISPYKTGTTYLSGCFNSSISLHEPCQYCSLKHIDRNFDKFFIQRQNFLNLKLECSGYLSSYVEKLSENEFTKEQTYICLLRKPSEWITSVINFWPRPSSLNFDYINEFFWKNQVGVDFHNFNKCSENEIENNVGCMVNFYISYLENTRALKNVHYVALEEIDNFLPELSELISEEVITENVWKRVNNKKIFNYNNEDIDRNYDRLISDLKNGSS